jgi:hypothetical protein
MQRKYNIRKHVTHTHIYTCAHTHIRAHVHSHTYYYCYHFYFLHLRTHAHTRTRALVCTHSLVHDVYVYVHVLRAHPNGSDIYNLECYKDGVQKIRE